MNILIKKFGMTLAILIILAALLSSLFRALTPWAKEYKGEVEQQLSSLLGQPVQIKTMETGWHWFIPVLKLQSVRLEGNQNPLKLDTIMLGLNIWQSLWHWQIRPGVLYIDKVNLIVRQKEDRWHLEGLGFAQSQAWSDEMMRHTLGLLLKQDKLVIKHVSLDIYTQDGKLLPLRDIHLILSRKGEHFRLRGEATQGSSSSSVFKIMSEMDLDPRHLNETAGQIYISAKKLQYDAWKSLTPGLSKWIQGLDGDIELWADINNGSLSSVQAKIAADLLVFKGQTMDYFKANIAFKPHTEGWDLTADDVQLLTAGRVWPENKVLIHHDQAKKSWLLYVKNLEIEAISELYPDWKKTLNLWEARDLHGLLTDLQIRVEDQKLSYFLSRFDQTGWSHLKQWPALDNISGVLQYQPSGGRLELDAQDVHLHIPKFPRQFFSIVNGAVEWRKQNNDRYDIQLERMELSKSDLALSMKGSITGLGPDNAGYRDLNIDFSGREVQQWLPWIPKTSLKKELETWLKNDIKRIGLMSGTLVLQGKMDDFPFDNDSGTFHVASHLSDVDLRIVSGFPLMQHVDINMDVNKRLLKADILNANLSGVPVHDMHVSMDDIGHDKEVLALNGTLQDEAEKILIMLRTTGLGKKPFFNSFNMQGFTDLAMQFQIPLYENKSMQMTGKALFNNNIFQTKDTFGNVTLEHLSGLLHFNEQGFIKSSLTATLFDSPLDIQISQEEHTGTDMSFKGILDMDKVKNHINTPLIRRFTGEFPVELHVFLDKASAVKKIDVTSSLQGLAIALPTPLGKTDKQSMPLHLQALIKNSQRMEIKGQYGSIMHADLRYQLQNNRYQFDTGVLRIGKTHAAQENRKGLQIVGTIPWFELDEWRKLMPVLSDGKSASSWAEIAGQVNVRIKKFVYMKQVIDDLKLQVSSGKNKAWNLIIKQKDIDAHLTWNPEKFSLAGYFTHLHISPAKPELMRAWNIAPKDLPDMNLRVDNLEYGALKLGNMTFNTKRSDKGMTIDYCKIEGPGYILNAKGGWEGGKKQLSNVSFTLAFNNLAKTLQHWNITPAVDASKGEASFKLTWAAPLYDFSFAKTDGELALLLRHGRITDLSRDTEQKLGLGKLLSILSLQTIPRRLTLDFSDLAGKGYSFDIFKGNFKMKKGVLHTEDSYIDGPVAYASMKGNLDVVQRLYDVELKVSPHITASLPVVATIAGGPVAGVAALVAGKIINQGMQQISGYTYRVTGPWSQPVVQQISIMKNKKQIENSEPVTEE